MELMLAELVAFMVFGAILWIVGVSLDQAIIRHGRRKQRDRHDPDG